MPETARSSPLTKMWCGYQLIYHTDMIAREAVGQVEYFGSAQAVTACTKSSPLDCGERIEALEGP